MPPDPAEGEAARMLRSVGCLAREGFMPGEVLASFPEPVAERPPAARRPAPARAPLFHRLAGFWLDHRATEAMP